MQKHQSNKTVVDLKNIHILFTAVINEPPILVSHRIGLLDDGDKAALGQVQVHRLRCDKVLRDYEQPVGRVVLAEVHLLPVALRVRHDILAFGSEIVLVI